MLSCIHHPKSLGLPKCLLCLLGFCGLRKELARRSLVPSLGERSNWIILFTGDLLILTTFKVNSMTCSSVTSLCECQAQSPFVLAAHNLSCLLPCLPGFLRNLCAFQKMCTTIADVSQQLLMRLGPTQHRCRWHERCGCFIWVRVDPSRANYHHGAHSHALGPTCAC